MIYNWDPRYALAKMIIDTALRVNFSKLVYTGKENIPKNVPLIFAPNHRNALIDALLVVYASPHRNQIVFLGRGDIFKKKFIAWILKGTRIIPVFRIRDGKDNLTRNDEIFEIAGKVLKNNNPIGIFPEATHNPKQSLLPIKKAVPRIVLPTEAQLNFELNSHIVPVSIYYTNVFGFLSECYVHFGKPILVSKYKETYYYNSNIAINQLRLDLEAGLQDIVVNIWNDKYYNEYKLLLDWNLSNIAGEKFLNQKEALYSAAHYIVKEIDSIFENDSSLFNKMIDNVKAAQIILDKYNLIDDWRVESPESTIKLVFKSILIFIISPIAVWGFVNNILPILIERKLVSLFKDKQFVASARFVAGLFCIPIFTIIQSLVVHLVFNDWLITIAYLIAMPISFIFAVYWRKWKKSVNRQWRINRFFKKYPNVWRDLMALCKL